MSATETGVAAADTRVGVSWSGAPMRFEATTDHASMRLEGGGERTAFSPMEALLGSVAGCMAIDVVDILAKMRSEVRSYAAEIEGWRAPDNPRRFLRIRLTHRLTGTMTQEQAERAVELSRTRYCSAMASLDPALVVENAILIQA
ncbi:MAG: OsmC family protein [Candidatus Dormibacteraeota bacterium]|nr:OsmC family protein [Candidatus Dormibacteraeota bacterium]